MAAYLGEACQDFVAFLEEVVAHCPTRQQIHIILDNLSAHKTRLVDEFLHKNPRVQFHFTPTYSSWLNQVELWFGKIERDLIARGVFTSVPGPGTQDQKIHQGLLGKRQAHTMEVLRPQTPYP